jgi:16S rRNA processing protein RimM
MTREPRTNRADVTVGQIAGLFGVRGELKCDPTSSGRSLFIAGATFRCTREGASEEVHVAAVREHKGRLLLTLREAPDAAAARRFVGATFFAPRDAIELGDDEYLDDELVGCMVRTSGGNVYGTVERVEHYPASDMLVIDGMMLPMVKAFIQSIDVASKSIVVKDLPEGLLVTHGPSATCNG